MTTNKRLETIADEEGFVRYIRDNYSNELLEFDEFIVKVNELLKNQ